MAKEKVKSNAVVTANWINPLQLELVVKDAGTIVFDMGVINTALLERATQHGFEQRLRDRAAMSADNKTGLSATAQDKFERIKALVEHYHAGGEWEMRGAGGGGKKAETEWILEALAAVKDTTVDKMREMVAAAAAKKGIATDKYLKQVATVEAVALKVAQLKFGDQEAAVDLDELGGE